MKLLSSRPDRACMHVNFEGEHCPASLMSIELLFTWLQ